MIVCIYGTTAEAIKVAPVIRRLVAASASVEQWLTYQHTDALDRTRGELSLGNPDQVIARGNDGRPIERPVQILSWLASVAWWTIRNIPRQRRRLSRTTDIVLVQGDTLTTVVGAVLARLAGVGCAHIEAGLRSGDWRNPFPEELDRRIVGRLAAIHYPPSQSGVDNLAGRRNIVLTYGNTVVDAAADFGRITSGRDSYGLVLLHRFELINNPARLLSTLRTLAEHSRVPLKVITDAYAGGPLSEAAATVAAPQTLQLTGKLPYPEFIGLLGRAQFVVTDSGGVQQEAAHLGVPTLIHRLATESVEGMGANAVLSGWDEARLVDFLENHEALRREPAGPERSPSQIIVDDLLSRGLGGGR